MKLFNSYNRILLPVVGLIFLLFSAINYFWVYYSLSKEVDESLKNIKRDIVVYVQKHNELPQIPEIDNQEIEITYQATNQAQMPVKLSSTEHILRREQSMHKFRQLEYIQPLGETNYQVTVARPLEGVHSLAKSIGSITLIILLLLTMLVALLNQLVLKKLWQPFYRALESLQQFRLTRGRMPYLPDSNIEEFQVMNAYTTSLMKVAQKDYVTLKEFIENASHEMQTPLSIIRSKLDVAIQEEGMSDNQTDTLKSIYSNISRLTKLNHSLLLLAKIENDQFSQKVSIDLTGLLQEKIEDFEEIWRHSNLQVFKQLSDATIDANESLIEILLNNLLSNAGRYNHAGGQVVIIMDNHSLTIGNTGPQKSLDTSRLFSRFYKGDGNNHNNGLGLSIVKQICDKTGITISYQFFEGQHTFRLAWQVI